jgi:hypothetical protein
MRQRDVDALAQLTYRLAQFFLSTLWLDTLLFVQGAIFATCMYLAFKRATICEAESSSADCPASQIAELASDYGCGLLFGSPCYRCCQLSSTTKRNIACTAASICLLAFVSTASDPQPGPMRSAHRRAMGLARRVFLHTCDIIIEGAKILFFLVVLKLLWSISQEVVLPRSRARSARHFGWAGPCYTGPRGGRYTITSSGRKNYNAPECQ